MEYSCEGLKSEVAQRYEVLLNMAPFGFLLIDLSGEIVEINRAALDILGSPSEDETKSINMLSYQPLEDVGVSQLIRDAIVTTKPISRVFEYTSKWNKTSTMKCTACSIVDNKKSICFVVFLIEDISDLERMRDKYHKMARTLASVVDTIETHYIWAKDATGKYQMVSKSYADLFFKTHQQMINLTDHDLYPKGMADAFKADDNEVLSSCGLKEVCEIVSTPLHGNRMWRTIKNAICDEDGAGIITVGIAEDVTQEYERRESAKKAIKDLKEFIERNHERTSINDKYHIHASRATR